MSNIRFAIIMGATSGIGYEVARILAQRGWKVGVAGRRKDILAKMVAKNDGIVAYEVVDVTSAQADKQVGRHGHVLPQFWNRISEHRS